MGKISPVSAKYIINTKIQAEGIIEKPDVIGAIFGQTEGLLGAELELRELQSSGRVGRIEVKLETRGGKTTGEIIIPSSLDKAETAIIGAALETIQRIGPCNSKVKVERIEDVRVLKRTFVVERAKELLKEFTSKVLPDSQEITDEVAHSVRMMEVVEYGESRLAAGPAIDESEELILVEGRADVLNLLKQGIKNVIALNGTRIPQTVVELSKKKIVTLFIDGDRGGDLILKGLIDVGVEIDFVAKASAGKEVEEITKKEIFKALRGKIALEQAKLELERHDANGIRTNGARPVSNYQPRERKPPYAPPQRTAYQRKETTYQRKETTPEKKVTKAESGKFKELLDDLLGTRGAYLLDGKLNVLGKIPSTELFSTIRNMNNIYAIVLDGFIDRSLAITAEKSGIQFLVATHSKVRPGETKIQTLISSDLK
ncbi:MAG: DNA primase [Nanoarchaeota archaeon]|nr:DNA primase [Nanoarchaeota archaeon]